METSGVTLQINLAPTDLPHARWVLPHQLRAWTLQVEEIILTLDLHRSRGRYAEGYSERLPGFRKLLEEQLAAHPAARSEEVDYSAEAIARVADRFFVQAPIPAKNWKGAPFYAYFYGLASASNRYVIHMDSDMLYGGGSATWVAEAVELLQRRDDVLACNPLPGPPTADGRLRSQPLQPERLDSPAFRADHISTRVFLIDLARLRSRIGPLQPLPASHRHSWMARLEGNPPSERAEETLSRAMVEHGLIRIDLLGRAPGMWSVHPPYRSERFYELLPSLVTRVENGDVPEEQRGCHELEDCMVDWSEVRQPPWRRVLGHARLMGSHLMQRSH